MSFVIDLAAGGGAGAISKTAVAPIERVKLLLQTQDSNPKIKSGEVRGGMLVCMRDRLGGCAQRFGKHPLGSLFEFVGCVCFSCIRPYQLTRLPIRVRSACRFLVTPAS